MHCKSVLRRFCDQNSQGITAPHRVCIVCRDCIGVQPRNPQRIGYASNLRLPGFTGTLCCISLNRHAFSCRWTTLFGSISKNIQSKRGCVYFTPRHLIGDLRISPTRPRNVKMVPVCPKLKTAVWGWTGTALPLPAVLKPQPAGLVMCTKCGCTPPWSKPRLFRPKGVRVSGGVLFSRLGLTTFFPSQSKHNSLL